MIDNIDNCEISSFDVSSERALINILIKHIILPKTMIRQLGQ